MEERPIVIRLSSEPVGSFLRANETILSVEKQVSKDVPADYHDCIRRGMWADLFSALEKFDDRKISFQWLTKYVFEDDENAHLEGREVHHLEGREVNAEYASRSQITSIQLIAIIQNVDS